MCIIEIISLLALTYNTDTVTHPRRVNYDDEHGDLMMMMMTYKITVNLIFLDY